ncbi:MAG: hypothetical protein RLZZ480_57 [Candidatus Parcubacteria bacterium]|jgi:pimeloyl-ACP methyl ester carboxylesterase
MRTITIDGMSFPVLERHVKGGEVPLLLINGMRMELGVFNQLKRELTFSTINFNFPTWWSSPSWRWALSPMGDFAHKVSRLLDELGHDQVDVLGVSWGGTLAIELATQYASRVRRLVLVSTTARPHRMWRPVNLKAYLNQDYGGEISQDQAFMTEVKSGAGSSPLLTDAYRGVALPFWVGAARLPFVTQPTCIINGTDDTITPQAEAEYMHHRIQNSSLTLVPRAGHLLICSDPKPVAKTVNDFLAKDQTAFTK